MMTELKDRFKEQVEQFNGTIDQLVNASKGLYIKAVEEGNKQFKDLVDAGAAQSESGENIFEQIRSDVTGPFEDIKSSLEQIKNASLGFVIKARSSSEEYFNELVELGQKEEPEEEV
ncbi:MAG: hypothetical protein MI976_12555 [Pseudomonadales bacterium]|nr:hypothetical protein [Pseudomonadales bacterium]